MAYSVTPEEFKKAYEAAPRMVQAVLNDASTEKTVDGIRSAHQLHVDVSGKLSELLDYLLLGLVSPSDFYKELLALGIPNDTADAIVKEVNEQIFQPLQKRMREESATGAPQDEDDDVEDEEAIYDPRFDIPETPAATVVARESTPLAPVMQVGTGYQASPSAPVREYAAPASTPPTRSLEPEPSSHGLPAGNVPLYSHPAELMHPQAAQMPTATHPQAAQSMAPAPSEPYLPYARTMAEDMERAAHGLTGQPATPARSFQTASVPVTFAQPRTVPAQAPVAPPQQYSPAPAQPSYQQPSPAPQPVSAPNYAAPAAYAPSPAPAAPVMAPIRLTPVDRTHGTNAPITKEFGSDPYREPISESV